MKRREYCCCAIPLVNTGIYATLTEQLTLGILVGTLAIATPSIVGAATPVMAPWILAFVAYAAAGIQIFGFIGVFKEKPIAFRRYVTLHVLSTVGVFSVAIVWIIMSATRHSTAQSKCQNMFFPSSGGATVTDEGQILCNIFPWVDVGIMGGLWVFFAITQFYFYLVVSSYSTLQERDYATFHSDSYEAANPLTVGRGLGDIPMTDRIRTSPDVLEGEEDEEEDGEGEDYNDHPPQQRPRSGGGYGHLRQESEASNFTHESGYHPNERKESLGKPGYGESLGDISTYDPYAKDDGFVPSAGGYRDTDKETQPSIHPSLVPGGVQQPGLDFGGK